MNHRDRNAHAQLRATARADRLARHDACCEPRTTPAQRRRMAAVTRWTLIAGALALAALPLIR